MNLDALTTEAVDPRFADIDRLGVAELARIMNEADQQVAIAVRDALDQITPAIEAVSERMQCGGRLLYVGAGTPGRIGVLDASEIPPTFSEHGRVIGIIAGGERAIKHAVEGAEDSPSAGADAIAAAEVGPLDSVIGVAASGRTPFVIGAVNEAIARGAIGVGVSCNADTPLSAAAEYPIEVIVGPEFISGSTRLKAGTAQKLVLNMFSTISMVRLGKTYGNLMVDVNASNEKLRRRAVRLVTRIAKVDDHTAEATLASADYSVPVAAIALCSDVDVPTARHRLARADGRLRDALDTTTTTDGSEDPR